MSITQIAFFLRKDPSLVPLACHGSLFDFALVDLPVGQSVSGCKGSFVGKKAGCNDSFEICPSPCFKIRFHGQRLKSSISQVFGVVSCSGDEFAMVTTSLGGLPNARSTGVFLHRLP